MTVQNVKYMQSIFRKYQIFAIACALLTLIAAVFAALSGIQLNNLRKEQAKSLENASLTSSQVNADVQKELKETKLFLKSSQQQLNEEKEKVERLQQMLNALERQLSAAQAKAALKGADEATATPKPPAVSPTPKARRQPPGTNNPAGTPIPSPPNEPQSSVDENDPADARITAPEAISSKAKSDPAATSDQTQNTSSE